MKIKTIYFPEPNKVLCEEEEKDISLGTKDIAIRAEYSIISAGTELAKLTGLQKVDYPFVPGNRGIGRVEEVGKEVVSVAPGDRVFSHIPHANYTPASPLCVKIPPNLDGKIAVSVGMATVAMTAIRVSEVELGDWALVTGLGIVGNLCAQLLTLSGAKVIGADPIQFRRDTAMACGVREVIDPSTENTADAVMELTEGRGAELAVETSGIPAVVETAANAVGRLGEVILLGSPRGEYKSNLTDLLNRIHLSQGSITFKGAHEWRYPLYRDRFSKHSIERNAEILFQLMIDGKLNIEKPITHYLPPEEAEMAYEGLLNNKDQYLGVVFDWRNSG